MNFNTRKIFIYSILLICIIAINVSVFSEIAKKPKNNNENGNIIIDTALLTENFNNIFDNKMDYQNNIFNFNKKYMDKDVVYTNYSVNEKSEGLYELNVNIPYFNINNSVADKINNEINELFYKKTNDILTKNNKNIIYNVKYKAYLNNNIVSLIISASLKEGENAQRQILKTYNYNLSSNSEMNMKEILEYRGLKDDEVQEKINKTIKTASENANQYKELGYNKYLRNVNDSMYKLENTKIFFLGESKALYILYPYGNSAYTSEVDFLVM